MQKQGLHNKNNNHKNRLLFEAINYKSTKFIYICLIFKGHFFKKSTLFRKLIKNQFNKSFNLTPYSLKISIYVTYSF